MRRILLRLGIAAAVLAAGAAAWWFSVSPSARLAEARSRLDRDQVATGIESLAHRFPSDAETQFLYARHLVRLGKASQARASLNSAARLGWPPPQVQRLRTLAQAQIEFGGTEQGLREFLVADPDDRDVLLALASGLGALDRWAEAEALADRVLATDPDDGAALCVRGEALIRRDSPERAYADLDRALAKGPDGYCYPTAQFQMANCLNHLGQVERAVGLFRGCRDRDPGNLIVLFSLGESARVAGRPEEALAAFEDYLRAGGNPTPAILQMARLYDEAAEYEKAATVLRRIEGQSPDNLQFLAQMTKTLTALGDDSGAADYRRRYEEIIRVRSKPPSH
jgi:tetratricopeptide (TPR) repeat protein